MDQLRKMKQRDEMVRQASRNAATAESSRGLGVVPFKWESQAGRPKASNRHEDSGEESEAHEPRVVQLNLKASLMGVQILDDDEEFFFSRQSSMSSMISEQFRSGGAVPFKWEAEPGKPINPPKDLETPMMPLMPPPGSRVQSGLLYSQPLSAMGGRPHSGMLFPGGGSRAPSGVLYPCPNPGSRANSIMLNAAHFSFGGNTLGLEAGTSDANNLTEKIFKKLVGQSRLHQSNDEGEERFGNNLDAQSDFDVVEDDTDSPVSTLDLPRSCPPSPTSSERSIRGRSTRKSLRNRSDDANSVAASLSAVQPNTPRPKSQLAQYLMSIASVTKDMTDDDDVTLEGPSEVAWLEPEEQNYHPDIPVVEGYKSSNGKKKPTHERWTSNSGSWNLSLVQKPLKTVSTIVNRSKHLHHTVPGSAGRKWSRRDKDAIMPISLTTSYDGGSKTGLRRAVRSEFNSGRSWWPESGSGRNSYVIGSGRFQIQVADEPDLDEPDMEQANHVNRSQKDERAKVDEEEFPFDSPIASSFVFGEADKKRLSDAQHPATRDTFPKAVARVVESENEDLHSSDNYHDLDDADSNTESEHSHNFSLDREGNGMLDQPPQWVPSRSFNYVKEVVDSIGLSSRGMSSFLEIGRSGRFSIDLQRGQRLDKAEYPRSPDVRLRIIKSEKPSRRSLLSPCLPFLHRTHKNVPKIEQAPGAGPPPRLQPFNSFTARLGPVVEAPVDPAGQFQFY